MADGDIGPVRLQITGVVAGSARLFSSDQRRIRLTDTHLHVSAPMRQHAGYDVNKSQPETSVEELGGDAVAFELGSVPVSFEPGLFRSKLRIGDFDLRVRPLERGKARKLAELASGAAS